MKNDGSTLDSILKKAGSFSEQIGKVHSLAKQLQGEKAALAEKETSLENDLLALVDTLYSFQQETISTLSELYAKLQSKADAEKKPPVKKEEPADFEITLEPKQETKPKPKTKLKPKEKLKPEAKPEEKSESKERNEEEEVYLFDL